MSWDDIRELLEKEVNFQGRDVCVIPIWPQYSEAIFSRVKRYEYRKLQPRLEITDFVVYQTAPTSKIVGYFFSNVRYCGSPQVVWNLTEGLRGIAAESYSKYFAMSSSAVAILIEESCLLQRKIDVKQFHCAPPQSYVYI